MQFETRSGPPATSRSGIRSTQDRIAGMTAGRLPAWNLAALGAATLLGLAACGGGGGSGSTPGVGSDLSVTAVHYGRLADVYGLRRASQGVTVELYRTDVLVGPDIQDERGRR